MKKSELQELKTKPRAELEKLLRETREELRKVRFDLEAGKVKNVSRLRRLKKDIARLLTLLNTRINKT